MTTLTLSTALAQPAEITRSAADDKAYRYFELDNRLSVLVVSDPRADKAAASLDVHVGSGTNPPDWQGLAHFLEHMLFLGTKKYPEAGEYQEFIKSNGGSNNAYTSFDHTNYYFSISPDLLEPALDRFSRFFIDPTFDALYVDRERSVVHSEYQARKKDEGRRLWDAQKKWLNPDHPAAGFSVGSEDTLRDREGQSARDKLIDFYENYYSANIMALAVVGNQSLDTLEDLVREKFSSIPDRNIEPQNFDIPYRNQALVPSRLEVLPEKEIQSLQFSFSIPSTLTEYREKPLGYISNLLGHEGPGSALAVLKERGWADSLSAGPGYMDLHQGVFNISIGLTETGLGKIREIGSLLFESISLLSGKGIEEWRYLEQSTLADISFANAQERDAGRLAQSLASRLHVYAPEDVLSGPFLMLSWNEERCRELLAYLRPDNVNIQVVSRSLFADATTPYATTPYYDVPYRLSAIEPETVAAWQRALDGPVSNELALPGPNPFVPDRLVVNALESMDKPVQLQDTGEISAWYAADTRFDTPRANFYFSVMSPLVAQSARNTVLAELYVRMINNQLSGYVYPAYLADLGYRLYRHSRGISVKISGFEDKQSELISIVTGALQAPEFDAQRFGNIKARLEREFRNVTQESPSSQTVHEIYRLLMVPYWTEQERLAELDDIQLEDLQEFQEKFYREASVTVLSHGDVTRESTLARIRMLVSLFPDSRFLDHVDPPKLRLLDNGSRYLRTMQVDHNDSALATYFQGSGSTRSDRARLSLLRQLLESSFYNQLRTINRVGYLVHAGSVEIDRNRGLLLSVQSPTHDPAEIYALYEAFLDSFAAELEDMPEAQFDSVRAGFIKQVLRKDQTLTDQSDRYWREIDDGDLEFNSRDQFVQALMALSLDHMREYFNETILKTTPRLVVQTVGKDPEQSQQIIGSEAYIPTGDATHFREAVPAAADKQD